MKRIGFLIASLTIFSLELFGQDNNGLTFTDIQEILLEQRPQAGNSLSRYDAITTLDQIILEGYPPLDPGTRGFMRTMFNKAVLEIRNEVVTEGATVWQIYNLGFVVKTPSACFGIDLVDYDYGSFFHIIELAPLIDALFISHQHHDHYSPSLVARMNSLGKPVIGPGKITGINEVMHAGDQKIISNLLVKAHFGLHSVTALQYEVTTPEGIKILHTGDNQTSETIPAIPDVNILLLNAWVNESGSAGHITGVRRAINKVKPDVCLPGHILELGHLGGGYIVPYSDVFNVPGIELPSEFYVLAWGERYHFPQEGNDIIRPKEINNPGYWVDRDTLRIAWDAPQKAEDGNEAAFYRLIMPNHREYYTYDNNVNYSIDSTGNYSCKIYSYDHCGNQSNEFVALEIVIDSFSSAPRISGYYPLNTDTIDVFQGVQRAFKIMAYDLNHDSLSYSWTLDNDTILKENHSVYIYTQRGIDPGIHHLTVHVSDQDQTIDNTWVLRHFTDSAIVDDLDSLMFYMEGDWSLGSGRNSHRRIFQYSSGSGILCWAGYLYDAEREGTYDLYANVPQYYSLTSRAEYTILVNNQVYDSLYLNQLEVRGGWAKVGSFSISAESRVEVRVARADTLLSKRNVVADALSFKYVDNTLGSQDIDENLAQDEAFFRHFPNPFVSNMHLEFYLREKMDVRLSVLNLLGEEIKTPVSGNLPAGYHEYILNVEYLPEGVYFYFFKAGQRLQSGKMIKL
jgi:hypothetical protein